MTEWTLKASGLIEADMFLIKKYAFAVVKDIAFIWRERLPIEHLDGRERLPIEHLDIPIGPLDMMSTGL